MFRHEKPQKGRYREFTQFGVEVFGVPGIGIELELLAICQRLWVKLGIENDVQLQVNNIGTIQERSNYRNVLIDYFQNHYNELDEDSKKRLNRSPCVFWIARTKLCTPSYKALLNL